MDSSWDQQPLCFADWTALRRPALFAERGRTEAAAPGRLLRALFQDCTAQVRWCVGVGRAGVLLIQCVWRVVSCLASAALLAEALLHHGWFLGASCAVHVASSWQTTAAFPAFTATPLATHPAHDAATHRRKPPLAQEQAEAAGRLERSRTVGGEPAAAGASIDDLGRTQSVVPAGAFVLQCLLCHLR